MEGLLQLLKGQGVLIAVVTKVLERPNSSDPRYNGMVVLMGFSIDGSITPRQPGHFARWSRGTSR